MLVLLTSDGYTERGHEKLILGINSRDWFNRVRTLQEMALARPGHIVAICGTLQTNYDWIHLGLSLGVTRLTMHHTYRLNKYNREALFFRSIVRQAISYDSAIVNGKLASYILGIIMTCKATDPKDIFYSILEILKRIGVNMPNPDYSKSIGNVYP